jgi:tetratricopeptide (TPR) repeat protein
MRDAIWNLARADTPERERARRRLVAAAALALLFSGLLTAIGLGRLVATVGAAAVVVAATAAARRTLPRYWPSLRARASRTVGWARASTDAAMANSRAALRYARTCSSSGIASIRVRLPRVRRACARRLASGRTRAAATAELAAQLLRAQAAKMQEQRRREAAAPPAELHREAIRLNAAGTRCRRNGSHQEAADLHRRALELLLGLHDPRAVALTENNLALALSHLGEDDAAITLFERAAATLHDLGETEHEGRVIANLGLAHRRHGRDDESENVLRLALRKLPPSSNAYETVEAALRHAS